jgi:hypothetical protein
MQRETRTTTPTAHAAAMPAFAPVLRPEESAGGTAVEDGAEVDIVNDAERVEGVRRGEVVAEGDKALWGVALGADADVGDDEAACRMGVS